MYYFIICRFSWLPVYDDGEEAVYIYEYMCDLVQANHPVILGNNNCNLPRILSIIAQAFESKIIEAVSDVGQQMLAIVKQVEANSALFQVCASQLTPDQQLALQEAYRQLYALSARG